MNPVPEPGTSAGPKDSAGRAGQPGWRHWLEADPPGPLEQAGISPAMLQSDHLEVRHLRRVAWLRLHSLQGVSRLVKSLQRQDLRLPVNVNEAAGVDPAALCLAPGDWYLFSEFLAPWRLYAQLQADLDPDLDALTDLTAGICAFRLSGSAAPWLASKLCGLDLFDPGLRAPWCSRTRLQNTGAVLHHYRPGGKATGEVYDLIVDRSLAVHTWALLLDAAPHAQELDHQFGPRK